jgi:hypothetical protein
MPNAPRPADLADLHQRTVAFARTAEALIDDLLLAEATADLDRDPDDASDPTGPVATILCWVAGLIETATDCAARHDGRTLDDLLEVTPC